tara:strand:+ start:22 stop:864 length:843 start_codon:yes stop_codon:yes gene_type:complete
MKNLYVVMGGLGKAVLWTSLIPSLCKKDGVDKISVMSPWPFLFNKHNLIENHEPLYDFRYFPQLEIYDKIIYHEPYLSDYLKEKDQHMLDNWADAYGIERVPPRPILNPPVGVHSGLKITGNESFELSERLETPYYIIQFTGGMGRQGENQLCPRDYRPDLVERLNAKIKNNFNLDCVCFRYEHEPRPSGTITFRSKMESGVLAILPLVVKAKFVICIDSALMHFAAYVKDKPTVVLWNTNQTTPNRIGYDFQENILCDTELCIDTPANEVFDKILEIIK